MASFGDEHPDQPVGAKSNRMVMVLAGAGVVLASGLAAKAYLGSQEEPVVAEASVGNYVAPSDPRRFRTGYGEEPKPEPPPAPPVVLEPKPAPVVAKPAPAPPPELKSAFIGEFSTLSRPPGQGGGGIGGAGGAPAPGVPGEYRPGMNDGRDSLGEDAVQGQSAWKNRWLAQAGTQGADYVTAPWMPAISPTMIQAGTIIGATTLTAINSDLPGDVVAMINSPVCDTSAGKWLLMPPGTKLYGRYSDQLAPFQERAQVAWTRILFQNGSSQNIGSMPGVDATGASGAKGDVDRHIPGMAGAVGLSALLSIVGQTGQIVSGTMGGGGGEQTAIGVVGGGAMGGAGQTARSAGQRIIERQLNRANTLTIEPGSTISLLVNKDMALPAYEGRRCGG